ncbi:hypothetical protein QBC39DRAFT_8421 [Podospora conica]|nr:hypothetical protein QBC39DRAFT_8421 [Schizothecium conicum]
MLGLEVGGIEEPTGVSTPQSITPSLNFVLCHQQCRDTMRRWIYHSENRLAPSGELNIADRGTPRPGHQTIPSLCPAAICFTTPRSSFSARRQLQEGPFLHPVPKAVGVPSEDAETAWLLPLRERFADAYHLTHLEPSGFRLRETPNVVRVGLRLSPWPSGCRAIKTCVPERGGRLFPLLTVHRPAQPSQGCLRRVRECAVAANAMQQNPDVRGRPSRQDFAKGNDTIARLSLLAVWPTRPVSVTLPTLDRGRRRPLRAWGAMARGVDEGEAGALGTTGDARGHAGDGGSVPMVAWPRRDKMGEEKRWVPL